MAAVLDSTPEHLLGNGRPVTEELTISELKVTGSIPDELDGRYVRTGANPLSGTSAHPFFGDGMIHGVRLRDGNAEWYRNRYVQTPFIKNPSVDVLDPSRSRAAVSGIAEIPNVPSSFKPSSRPPAVTRARALVVSA